MGAAKRFLLGVLLVAALILAAVFLLTVGLLAGQGDGSAPTTPHSQPSPYPHAWEIKTR